MAKAGQRSVESQRDLRFLKQKGDIHGDVLQLPPIDGNYDAASKIVSSNRAIPMTKGALIAKKNNALLQGNSGIKSGLAIAQKDIDQQLEGFYKTEDKRDRVKSHMGMYEKPSMTKNERDDLVSNYFSDKRKLQK